MSENSLKDKFQGPYSAVEQQNEVNYVIKTPERRTSTTIVHVNLLKNYNSKLSEADLGLPDALPTLNTMYYTPVMESDFSPSLDVDVPVTNSSYKESSFNIRQY